MNFDEIQLIWSSQKTERLFALDETSFHRLVKNDALIVNRDLKLLELAAIVTWFSLAVVSIIDTFFNGEEWFQLFGAGVSILIAAGLWSRRYKREAALASEPQTLQGHVETAVKRVQATIDRGRDLAIVFSLFSIYGTGIRIAIYGWRGSEIKFILALVGIVIIWIGVKACEKRVHAPKLENFQNLLARLQEFAKPAG